jgi:amino acid adenylation domain-containing protein
MTDQSPGNFTQPHMRGDISEIDWSRDQMPFQRNKSVVDFFREQVLKKPEAIAIEDKNRHVSYAELDRLSNRVAHRLLREGLVSEEIVALLFDRSWLFIVSALGVIKAGGSYLPMDADSPDQRKSLILADSGTRFILAQTNQTNSCVGNGAMTIEVDPELSSFDREAVEGLAITSDPTRRAYLIYTSGSTGKPKGVEIEHHSLSNLVAFYRQKMQLGTDDRVTMIASLSFDVSVADLWPTLCTGATLLIPSRTLISNLEGLVNWLDIEKATFAFIPTALTELLLTRSWPPGISLRYLITGGDTLRVRPPGGLPFILINGYGPTENTVWSTFSVVSDVDTGRFPPIGRAIGNVKTYVLDEHRQRVPAGTEGELYLGGEQVARGYWNKPDQTRDVFLSDPFAEKTGSRMYKTGDWVCEAENGELHFIGRRDDQVQLYGHRIELAEVERVLMAHPSVYQVCCRPLRDEGAVTGVAAHIVPLQGKSGFGDELRELAMQNLPIAAVPEVMLYHDRFPMTPQGKVDRAILDDAVLRKFRFGSIKSPLNFEREIANLWNELLPDATDAGREANFFNLGGNSLTAARLLFWFEQITDRRLPLSSFLQNPTLEGLLHCARGDMTLKFSPLTTLSSEGNRPPIFFIYDLFGNLGCYLNLVKALGEDQPSFGFSSPSLQNPDNLPRTMEEAASEIVRLLQDLKLDVTPALIGYSWGGWLAFEVARQWIVMGNEAPFIGLIGTESPIPKLTMTLRVFHLLRWTPRWLFRLAQEGPQGIKRLFEAMLRLHRAFLFRTPLSDVDCSSPIMKRHVELAANYAPVAPRSILLNLFREKDEFKEDAHPLDPTNTRHEIDDGWGRWVGTPPRVHWIDSDHLNILQPPGASKLAVEIRTAMNEFYKL